MSIIIKYIIIILIALFIVWSFCADASCADIKIIELTADSFTKEVLESDKLIVIDFWAAWCKPCKILSPIIYRLAEFNQKYNKDKIKWFKVNVDKNRKFLNKFRPFRGLPVVVFYKNGKEVYRFIGVLPFIKIQDIIKLQLKEEVKEKKEKKEKKDDCNGGTCPPPEEYIEGDKSADNK